MNYPSNHHVEYCFFADLLLDCLLPSLIILHLLVAPYTKTEESFFIQATHDILRYGVPVQNFGKFFHQYYDHFSFPGVVPRTFLGSLGLAIISKPFILLAGNYHSQYIVRGILGIFNAYAIIRYKRSLAMVCCKNTGRWFILLLASQFHVIYYASRTLPNMFAFSFTTLAFGEFLPAFRIEEQSKMPARHKRGICLLVFAAVVFRSEIAVLLLAQLLYMLIHPRMSLEAMIPIGLKSASICLFITCVVDSYFWQYPVWPELSAFYFNIIQGKSADWGTSPFYYYYSHLLPKLLLNPVITLFLIPFGYLETSLRKLTNELIIPSLLYISFYSFLAHKEARFILYIVVPITGAASCSAAHIWQQSSKKPSYRMSSIILVASIFCSTMLSTGMLLISSLNYPGGHAISRLNAYINQTEVFERENTHRISIHIDVYSCMTGVTHFFEIPGNGLKEEYLPIISGIPTLVFYDRTEDAVLLAQPDWWSQFDYALLEYPELAPGNWDTLDTVLGYSGIKILRPGDTDLFVKYLENEFWADHISTKHQAGGLVSSELTKITDFVLKIIIRGLSSARGFTGGWWVGVQLEPKIRILKKRRDDNL